MCRFAFIQQILLIFFVSLFHQLNSPFCVHCSSTFLSPSPDWFNHMKISESELNGDTIVELVSSEAEDGADFASIFAAISSLGENKRNHSRPLFLFDFGSIEADKIAYNSTLFKLLENECKKEQCDTEGRLKKYEEAWKKASTEPDEWNGPENVCTSDNTVMLFVCWESRFQTGGLVKPQFYINNKPNDQNVVSRTCGQLSPKMHGIGLGICVQKLVGIYSVHTTIKTSYSDKSYSLSTINLSMLDKNFAALSPLLLLKSASALTQFINRNGNQREIVNNDESSLSFNILPIRPSAFGHLIENDALGFAFMDMRVENVFDENGKTLLNKRKLHLLYPINEENGKKSCQIFSNMKLHDKWKNKDIELKGCNAEEKGKVEQCQNDKICNQMLILRQCICESMWLCEKQSYQKDDAKPPPSEYLVPDYVLQIQDDDDGDLEPGNSEDKLRKEFYALKNCDNEKSLLFPGIHNDFDKMTPKRANEEWKKWEQKCGRGERCAQMLKINNMNGKRIKRSKGRIPELTKYDEKRPPNWEWRWKNLIIYKFSPEVDGKLKSIILAALRNIEKQTCIRFGFNDSVDSTSDHLYFIPNARCRSVGGIGRGGERHEIYIKTNKFGDVVHEIGHALGLLHEMSRIDVDRYIYMYEGYYKTPIYVIEEYRIPEAALNSFGLPYDYGSVMHYQSMWIRDRSGKKVYEYIPYLRAYQHSIGNDANNGLSYRDAKLLNQFYCNDSKINFPCEKHNKIQCKNDGYQDPLDCSKCRCPNGFAGKYCDDIAKNDANKCKGKLNGNTIKEQLINPLMGMITKFEGSIIGNGHCYWIIEPFNKEGNPVEIKWIAIKKYSSIKCASTLNEENCGTDKWIYPCPDYLRIQFQLSKIDSGARVFCQQQLPLVITDERGKENGTEIGEVLLDLHVTDSGLNSRIDFEIEITTDHLKTNSSCNCPDPMKLWKSERQPDVKANWFNNNNNNHDECMPNVDFYCKLPDHPDPNIETHFLFNSLEMNNTARIVDRIIIVNDKGEKIKEILLGAVLMITLNCLDGINSHDAPFWALRLNGTNGEKMPPIRVDEVFCYNQTIRRGNWK